jgi:hypothetical protein
MSSENRLFTRDRDTYVSDVMYIYWYERGLSIYVILDLICEGFAAFLRNEFSDFTYMLGEIVFLCTR